MNLLSKMDEEVSVLSTGFIIAGSCEKGSPSSHNGYTWSVRRQVYFFHPSILAVGVGL